MVTGFLRPFAPELPAPSDRKQMLWRYMDLSKFVAILSTHTLWFPRADQFDDRFEGSMSKRQKAHWEHLLRTSLGPDASRAMKFQTDLIKSLTRNTAISCWHQSEHESMGMWQTYLRSGEGIAVQSTVDQLMESFPQEKGIDLGPSPGEPRWLPVEFGAVRYVEYDEEDTVENGLLGLFLRKRRSFEHDREFRALISHVPNREGRPAPDETTFPNGGVAVRIDVEKLIQHVYVAPGRDAWFRDIVCSLVERYGFNFEVCPSRLDEDPVF